MEEKKSTEEIIAQEKAKVEDIMSQSHIEEILKNNEAVMEFGGVTYRVRRPTFGQKQQAYTKRVEKFTELLSNKKYLLESDLKKLYKDRGIDIDDLDNNYKVLEDKKNKLLLQLGQALKEKKSDAELKTLRDEITNLISGQTEISMRKLVLMESSIETQLQIYVYSYLAYLVVEKKEGENWIAPWKSYEEFLNQNEVLINKVVYNASLFVRNEIEL